MVEHATEFQRVLSALVQKATLEVTVDLQVLLSEMVRLHAKIAFTYYLLEYPNIEHIVAL